MVDRTDMRKTVLAAKPVLKEILEKHGDLSLFEYFKKSLLHTTTVSVERQEELLGAVFSETQRFFGEGVANSAVRQLKKVYYVSTADHHGPITHPFFGNSALIHSYVNRDAGYENIIVFPCAGISLDNSSFPRGFLVHDIQNELTKLHLVSRKTYAQSVFARDPYNKKDCEALEKEIGDSAINTETFNSQILPIYTDTKVLQFPTYSDQITYTNFHLWKQIPGQENMNLIYLEQESLVISLILKHHLGTGTFISRILNTHEGALAFAKSFKNIPGAFSDDKGTVLFWAIHEGRRASLRLEDGALSNIEKGIRSTLDEKSIREGLSNKTLMPSMALTYLVLSFYYGLHCGGGFSQVNYLTDMKSACISLLKDLGIPEEEYSYIASVDTQYFCGEFVLATLPGSDIAATPYDLILQDTGDFMEKSKTLTLNDAIDGIMPELYKIVTGGSFGEA